MAGHSTLAKRGTDTTGTRTQVSELWPVSLSGSLCCLPVDRALAGSRNLALIVWKLCAR